MRAHPAPCTRRSASRAGCRRRVHLGPRAELQAHVDGHPSTPSRPKSRSVPSPAPAAAQVQTRPLSGGPGRQLLPRRVARAARRTGGRPRCPRWPPDASGGGGGGGEGGVRAREGRGGGRPIAPRDARRYIRDLPRCCVDMVSKYTQMCSSPVSPPSSPVLRYS